MTISDWYIRIGNFLLGKISPNDFLDPKNSFLQNDIRKRCQAWMFAGEKSLAHDDKQTAIGCFQNCTATNQKGSAEYRLAQSELKALGK